MKNILVPVEQHNSLDSVLATACLHARRFGSYIEGLALGPDLPDLVAFDMPYSWAATDADNWKELVEESHQRFAKFMSDQGIPQHLPGVNSLSWGWSGERPCTDVAAGNYGRIFDIIILGRPGSKRGDARMATFEAALFESGRPVLLAPPNDFAPKVMGDHIVISWNQTMETARATRGALLILLQAKKVTVLTIEEWKGDGPTGDQMAERLQMHGIPAEAVTRSAKGKSQGEAVLEQAGELGGDLLIKGAYTQSRLREMIFGGTTSHILAKAKIPVLLSA